MRTWHWCQCTPPFNTIPWDDHRRTCVWCGRTISWWRWYYWKWESAVRRGVGLMVCLGIVGWATPTHSPMLTISQAPVVVLQEVQVIVDSLRQYRRLTERQRWEYAIHVVQVALEHDVPARRLARLFGRESAWNEAAMNPQTGAKGIPQLLTPYQATGDWRWDFWWAAKLLREKYEIVGDWDRAEQAYQGYQT